MTREKKTVRDRDAAIAALIRRALQHDADARAALRVLGVRVASELGGSK